MQYSAHAFEAGLSKIRRGSDDVWQGLALGQWLAHERRMQLLGVAAEVRLVTQVEAGASMKKTRFDLITEAFRGLCRFLPQHTARGRLLRTPKVR